MRFDNESSIPLEDFFIAYYQCRKRKRSTINALEFEVNYEENLVELWKDVNSRKYNIGRSICFLVSRPKLREIFAADFRDRIVHHVVMMRLEPLFEEAFINDNYNCRKGKGTLYGVKRLHEQIRQCSNNYTEDCYVGKFDMQGFFMSIHKPTLWKMLKEFIEEKYFGEDKEIILWLVEKIVMHCPQYNCIRKTPIHMWDRLAKNKSLFTCGDEYGLPIGNLTSQCFANFYLHWFDLYVEDEFGYYGRYVDDFYIICKDKRHIASFVPYMSNYLYSNLLVKLHPDKIYIQHYKKGVKFIGSVVKGERIYNSNVGISNVYMAIHKFNEFIDISNAEHLVQSLNSYWGFMKHYNSYKEKKKVFNLIDYGWFKYVKYNSPRHRFEIRRYYKDNIMIKIDFKDKEKFCDKYYRIFLLSIDIYSKSRK